MLDSLSQTRPGNPPGRLRTIRLVYLMAGLGISVWAITVPFTKIRFHLNDATLGLMLLAPGLAGIIAMPLVGYLTARFGSRNILLLTGIVFAVLIPALATAPSPAAFTILLLIYGAAFAGIDIGMNAQAVVVENRAGGFLMSSFHAMFSLGALAIAVATSLLLHLGLSNAACATICAAACLAILAQKRHLLPKQDDLPHEGPAFAWPNRATLTLGLACFACFQTEGAVTDWSTIFFHFSRNIPIASAATGYAGFAVMMTASRFLGDRTARRLGKANVMRIGCLLAAAGFLVAVSLPYQLTGIIGFAMVGLGIGNIAPLVFTAAAKIPGVPAAISTPAVMTLGYAGFLVGPVIIGCVANLTSLGTAFALNALLLLATTLAAPAVAR